MKNCCVYFHTTQNTNKVFYVGIGKKHRPYAIKHRNRLWQNVVNKNGYFVTIVESNLTRQEAIVREKYYIKLVGRHDLGTGMLVNMTDGGDGSEGFTHSVDSKIKMSHAGKNRKFSETHIRNLCVARQKRKMKPHTEESKKKTSDTLKRIGHRPKNIPCGWNKGLKWSPEIREKISRARLGQKMSPERKLKAIETLRNNSRWASKNLKVK